MSFKELVLQLSSASERTRHDAAMLLSAVGYRGAIGPLIRAYLNFGDQSLLEALAAYGAKLTPVAARQVGDSSLSPTQRARLMEVLAVSGDPGAVTVVLPVTEDPSPEVHVAASAALAQLGDPRGVDRLADDLLKFDPRLRTLALEALQRLEDPRARAAIEEYVEGYLAAGGAVPRQVSVALPLLVEPDADLAGLVADHVRRSPRTLTVVTGPAMDTISEGQRELLAAKLPGFRLCFATPRHSAEEQLEILARARDQAAAQPDARVVVVGRLPSPEGPQPFRHFLTCPAAEYSARIILVGPQRLAYCMEWWRYVDDRAEVPTELEVVLVNLVLGSEGLTAEELAIYHLAGEERREEFARAFLAQL